MKSKEEISKLLGSNTEASDLKVSEFALKVNRYLTQTLHKNTVLWWVIGTALAWLAAIMFALFYLLGKESPDSSIAIALISAGTTTAVIAPAFMVNAIFRRRRSKEELAEQMADIARAGTNASSEAAVN